MGIVKNILISIGIIGLIGVLFIVFSSKSGAPNKQVTIYTNAEVANHSNKQDCWTIINSNVYNISDYITKHPGGESNILLACGKDGTKLFTTRTTESGEVIEGGGNHSKSAYLELNSYYIGKVE